MVDITDAEFNALESILSFGFKKEDYHEEAKLVDSAFEKIQKARQSWSDPSVDEISYYPAGDDEYVSLGKQLIFDPHTRMSDNLPGVYFAFPNNSVLTHRFEIDKDHTGLLIIPATSWLALNGTPSTEAQKSSL